ncbi:MAG: hypothetical protein Q8S13_01580 [Dehalococcoidia bacterium]|nr:hypothetical protein [Dehalococcoidia bacterium]
MSRAVRLWRLEQRARALSASLHRLTSEATRTRERITDLRLRMMPADQVEYDQLARLEGQRETEEAGRR